MKKKTVTKKDNAQRMNTPEPILKKRPQKQKIKMNPINEGEINQTRKKTANLKNPGPLTIHPTITNMTNLPKMANNKTKVLKNSELTKSSMDIKKENKTESQTLNTESKKNSGHRRVIKFKKEDNSHTSQKNIKGKDNNPNKDNNNQNDKEKDNKDILNQTEESINRSQTIIYKYGSRGKSFDITVEKKKMKSKESENENNKTIETNTKKRKPEIALEKTPNRTKAITLNKKKDITSIKAEKSNDRKEVKFAPNKTKRPNLNKTPDAGKLRNHKKVMSGNLNKKTKYGNAGNIKSILRSNKPKEKEKENINNNDIKLNDDNKDNTINDDNKVNEVTINNDNKVNEVKIINYKNIKNKKYNSNYVESLYLALNSGFFNPNKKLNIIINSKELYSNFEDKKIIKELIDYYNKTGNQIITNNNDNNKYDLKKINEAFKPNERTINALNFLDKNEEQKLINEIQHPYINELFKAVLILLNEYKNNNENKNIFEFLFNDIVQKYKAKNIKKLMINYFVNDRLIINDEQIELIQKMLITKPDLFSPATLLRYNRAVAYFSFFIKELFSYLNLKTEDGKYYYKIRESLPNNIYHEKINKLKQLL